MRISTRITAFLATAALGASLLSAQEAPAAPKPPTREATIISIKTLTGDSFNRLVGLLAVFNVQMRADEQLRTILVYSDPDTVAQIRKVVAELDKPGSQAAIGRNIEMTLSFLRCLPNPSPNARKVPADLEPVARELQRASLCQNAELWDILPMRLQEGKDTEQSLRLPDTSPGTGATQGAFSIANIRMQPTAVGTKDQGGRFVRFNTVRVNFRIPVATGPAGSNQFQYIEVGINTAGDFLESQKTVLGKVAGSDNENIYVVVALKVLD